MPAETLVQALNLVHTLRPAQGLKLVPSWKLVQASNWRHIHSILETILIFLLHFLLPSIDSIKLEVGTSFPVGTNFEDGTSFEVCTDLN